MGDYREMGFRRVWAAFELEGRADGAGGAQFLRCKAAWVKAGRPVPIRPWMLGWLLADNQVPHPKPAPPGGPNGNTGS